VEDILQGWKPDRPLISADTKALAFGSCFAEYFVKFLALHDYNRWQLPIEQHSQSNEELLVALPSTFENVFVILQHLRWAFQEFTPAANLWFTKDKNLFEATEERREKIRQSLAEADVLVITLGLSEIWMDQAENEPMWRTIPARLYEPGRHVSRIATVPETLQALYDLDALLDRHSPGKQVIFTLSPIPLFATFRDQSAVTANSASKAVLRAALDQFFGENSTTRKDRYHYFPSYEIVFHLFDNPFLPDNRHIRPEVAAVVLDIFSSLYTDLPRQEIEIPEENSYSRVLEQQIRDLETELEAKEGTIRELDQAARQRLAGLEAKEQMIRELDQAARQRLADLETKDQIIRELDQAARERLAIIERITREANRPSQPTPEPSRSSEK